MCPPLHNLHLIVDHVGMRRSTFMIIPVSVVAMLTVGMVSAPTALANDTTPELKGGQKSSIAVLNGLSVKGETGAGYSRSKFTHWTTKNGCDTRARVLKAESQVKTTKSGKCTIRTGRWYSAYDGVTFTSASRLDVDHLVPLKEAWDSGAKKWNSATRKAFANDVGYKHSLIAVSASSNRSKSDNDPDLWMPPVESYACTYLKQWVAVKYRWRLAVDSSERAFIAQGLTTCGNPSMSVPSRGKVVNDKKKPGSSPSKPSSVYYRNCDAARADGAAPVYAGDPGYGRHLDRDGDGVGCE